MYFSLLARPRLLAAAIAVALLLMLPVDAGTQGGGFLYQQQNLVSDLLNLAKFRDKTLVNPWGLSRSPDGPWQVSDNGTGLSTQYTGAGKQVLPAVAIPTPNGVRTAAPTGNVFNGTIDFVISKNAKFSPSQFLFATEDGTISGFSPNVDSTHAILVVDRSAVRQKGFTGAVYKGLALATSGRGSFLFATNFRFGVVEKFDTQFRLVASFTDPDLARNCPVPGPPAQCFAPFGIQSINDLLYVTFALQDSKHHDDVAGAGNGFVDVFDTDGNLRSRFASQGTLDSPWGLTLAPANFGTFSRALLVGNFGDGRINAFNALTGRFLGQLQSGNGNAIAINGLWGLAFGNGFSAGNPNTLFFTAGFNDEADGLFGTIVAE